MIRNNSNNITCTKHCNFKIIYHRHVGVYQVFRLIVNTVYEDDDNNNNYDDYKNDSSGGGDDDDKSGGWWSYFGVLHRLVCTVCYSASE